MPPWSSGKGIFAKGRGQGDSGPSHPERAKDQPRPRSADSTGADSLPLCSSESRQSPATLTDSQTWPH